MADLPLGPIISVDINARRLTRALRALDPEVLFGIAYSALEESLVEVTGIVKENTPVDTAQTRDNIYWEIHGTRVQDLNGIIASPDAHFRVLEYGRRPGSRMPPEQPILEWVERHGISGKSSVYLIRRAIAQRGLPAHHIMENAVAESRDRIQQIWVRKFVRELPHG